ncbi:MAG: ANTAR domain-containing protein [Clostridia bacterium]|nr:ANTAR domain-containing protein [Clostridia bacterium]MDE7215644.1 ANTAR domain-containing protein [Clostridia bacterium]MDE7337297.1 ANTAR domain-containing protein [Clostridia bacterium]
MPSALIVSTAEYAKKFSAILGQAGYGTVTQAYSGTEARQLISDVDFALLIINAPLVDEFGYDLAIYAAENTTMSVLILARADIAEAVEARVEDYGVVAMSKPISQEGLFKTLKALYANHNRMNNIIQSNRRLQDKLEELRLVDRAKCILIALEGMSEEEAHKYIEKNAMDMRISKKQVAQKIISLKQHD